MILLPAIDILEGRCVRLIRGDYATSHEVAADPLATALAFREAGATWLHMVDLDGARTGRRENGAIFLEIAEKSGLSVEVGGGIRDRETIDYYLRHGVTRVILGTAAIKSPDLVAQAVGTYGDRIAVGIDAKDGMVMIEGWLQDGRADYLTVAKQMEDAGAGALIFTDISRDGTLNGPNIAPLRELKAAVSCPLIASGGVRDLDDVRALAALGIDGVICGKAIYSGTLDLAEAIRALAHTDGA